MGQIFHLSADSGDIHLHIVLLSFHYKEYYWILKRRQPIKLYLGWVTNSD